MKKITIGIVAPVDAGKTTLSEAMLYHVGTVRKRGRVDHGDTFLDPGRLEKRRGITISAHAARLKTAELTLTLLDTPGHVDFAAATEQVLAVLDYAVLVIAAPDRVNGSARFLWRLLARNNVPTFIFINKTDAPGADVSGVIKQLQSDFDPGCVAFAGAEKGMTDVVAENAAAVDEATLNDYLTTGQLSDATTIELIAQRQLFPVLTGAALQDQGVSKLLVALGHWTRSPHWAGQFGARCFKVSHDRQGNRLSWLRVTGGTLQAKEELLPGEKADQVRVYNGTKFQTVQTVTAGDVCAVAGLTSTYPGMSLGTATAEPRPIVRPVLSYAVTAARTDIDQLHRALDQLADEDPALQAEYDPQAMQCHLAVVGKVQLETVQQRLHDEFEIDASFGTGRILYRETVTKPIEGVGHFEPLRHYAEVHLKIEPGPAGSGVQLANRCRVEDLPQNWQHQVMTALGAKTHRGVLIGAPLTNVKITLLGGKGNIVHSVGGDFRQATWRAVRQGLMELGTSGNQLLEPWYQFRLTVPVGQTGRALTDISQMGGQADVANHGDQATLKGTAPVATMADYAAMVRSYTHGEGQLELVAAGNRPCHNAAQVIEAADYHPKADLDNTPDSVFCAHGAGYPVDWDAVPATMHVPYYTNNHP